MPQRPVIVIVTFIMVVVVLVLVVGLYTLTGTVATRTGEFQKSVAALEDSVISLRAQVDSLRDRTPGLGEYMSTFQLHVAKMWYAAHASNWDLASYELGELKETMDAAETLHAVKNSVNISNVLQSVRQTQAVELEQALNKRNEQKFERAYSQTLVACNSCHRSSGYGFVHITIPSSPPVSNQSWKLERQ